jgi:uncharacterized protein YbbK (DUF523 family)
MTDDGAKRTVWLVSACLVGERCRYDGKSAKKEALGRLRVLSEDERVLLVPICPEMEGGLGTPRPPADLRGGDGGAVLAGRAEVRTREGKDVTEAFIKGAEAAARAARESGATHACLKARSPSCGVGQTHMDGSLVPGDGVTGARLKALGLRVCTDEDLEDLKP